MLSTITTRAGPHRSLVLPMVLALTLATGVVLASLAQLLVTGPVPSTAEHIAPSANVAVIRAFYAAANRTLSTGNPAEITSFVAPDFVGHRGPSGTDSGRDDLIRSLISLHTAFPGVRIAVDDLVAQADQVAARVRLTGVAPSQFAGLVLPASLAVWGDIDLFRLEDGAVVEHWGGRANTAEILPLQRASLPLPFGSTVTSATRLTFRPPDNVDLDSSFGPKLLYVESGRLAVTIKWSRHELAGSVQRAQGTAATRDLASAERAASLGVGDMLLLSPGTFFTAKSETTGQTVALELALQEYAPFVAEKIKGAPIQRLLDNVPSPLPNGVVTVTAGAASLAPGTSLQIKTASGVTLVAVESGKLELAMAASGAWIQRGSDGSTLGVGSLSQALLRLLAVRDGGPPESQRRGSGRAPTMEFPTSMTLGPGDTTLVEPDASGVIRNAGDTPLALTVVSFVPDPPAAGTPEASPLELDHIP